MISIHGSLKLENGNSVFMLLYCRIIPDFIFYHENTKEGKLETFFSPNSFSCFRLPRRSGRSYRGLFGLSGLVFDFGQILPAH